MRLPTSFPDLDRVRVRMGTALKEWSPGRVEWSDTASIVHEPIEIEIRNLDQLGEGAAGTIVVDDRRVFLYIREPSRTVETFEEAVEKPEDLSKFHVAWCDVLKRMKREGRFERYVASERVDEPFGIALRTPDGSWTCGDAELLVCRRCLGHLNWRGFSTASKGDRSAIVGRFSRREFLATEAPRFASIPSRYDSTAPAMGYAADWAERSKAYRSSARWICEGCKVDCSGKKSLLDAHHRNGVTSDNAPQNLRALCKLCHAAEHPNWYRVALTDKSQIEALRRKQSICL